jgi:hypothetical protein
MESPAQVAERLGIPSEKLTDLLELPEVAELLVVARESPGVPSEAIFIHMELPLLDAGGLDIDALLVRLGKLRALGSRSDGQQHSVDVVRGSGAMVGRYQRAAAELGKREETLEHLAVLLGRDDGSVPALTNLGAARKILLPWAPW